MRWFNMFYEGRKIARSAKKRYIARAPLSAVEPLEGRLLMTCHVGLVGSSIAIEGNDFDNAVQVLPYGSAGRDVVVSLVCGGGVTRRHVFDGSSVTKVVFTGHDGDDTLVNNTGIPLEADAGPGNDTVTGGRGNDTIDGGSGRDILVGLGGDDTLRGGTDEDHLSGGGGRDRLQGDHGDDTLSGGAGSDILEGGTGADQLNGGEDGDTLYGGPDNDVLKGMEGSDTLKGGSGDDELFGDDRHEKGFHDYGHDRLFGEQGEDKLWGGAGNDLLSGGRGDDTLWGGRGNDELYGESGFDILYGQSGDDYLDGGLDCQADELHGGRGADTFVESRYHSEFFVSPIQRENEMIVDHNLKEGDEIVVQWAGHTDPCYRWVIAYLPMLEI